MKDRNIGVKIRKLRELRGMTQKELGNFLNCSEFLISRIEKGDRTLTVQNLQKIAKIFDVDYDYFFGLPVSVTEKFHFRTDSRYGSETGDNFIKGFEEYAKKIVH